MFTIRETAETTRHRNDFLRSIQPSKPVEHFALVEARIRRQARELVRDYLKYTTKGQRGAGKTNEHILNSIRWARLDHTASIRRQRAWAEAL